MGVTLVPPEHANGSSSPGAAIVGYFENGSNL
jgi:hypothetical protein